MILQVVGMFSEFFFNSLLVTLEYMRETRIFAFSVLYLVTFVPGMSRAGVIVFSQVHVRKKTTNLCFGYQVNNAYDRRPGGTNERPVYQGSTPDLLWNNLVVFGIVKPLNIFLQEPMNSFL